MADGRSRGIASGLRPRILRHEDRGSVALAVIVAGLDELTAARVERVVVGAAAAAAQGYAFRGRSVGGAWASAHGLDRGRAAELEAALAACLDG